MTDFNHLHREIRSIAARGEEERIGWIRSQARWIEYPAATKVQNRLWDVLTQPRSTRMENILLFAESGAGKTSLINAFQKRCAQELAVTAPPYTPIGTTRHSVKTVTQHPVITVLMPPEPDRMDLYRGILRAVDIPYVTRNHLNVMRIQDIVRNILQRSHTRLLILDEINSLLVGTPGEQRLFLQHLRFISNDLGIGLVCAGTPEARYALNSDGQLRRRFSDIELPPWEQGDALRDFINHYVQALPLQRPSPIDSEVLRQFMVSESRGITHYMCRAMERAAIAAIRTGREMLNLDSFQEEGIWDKPYV